MARVVGDEWDTFDHRERCMIVPVTVRDPFPVIVINRRDPVAAVDLSEMPGFPTALDRCVAQYLYWDGRPPQRMASSVLALSDDAARSAMLGIFTRDEAKSEGAGERATLIVTVVRSPSVLFRYFGPIVLVAMTPTGEPMPMPAELAGWIDARLTGPSTIDPLYTLTI